MDKKNQIPISWAIIIGAIIIAIAILCKPTPRYQFIDNPPTGYVWIMDTQTGERYIANSFVGSFDEKVRGEKR